MGHCVAQQQRLRFRKLTVLEYEHEFATVGIEALNRVWDQALGVRAGWPDGIRVLAIKRLIGRAGISSAPVCAASLCSHDFLQRGKAAYRYRGFSDETSTSECAHNYFS